MKKIKAPVKGKIKAKEVLKYFFFLLYAVSLAAVLYVTSPVIARNAPSAAQGETR